MSECFSSLKSLGAEKEKRVHNLIKRTSWSCLSDWSLGSCDPLWSLLAPFTRGSGFAGWSGQPALTARPVFARKAWDTRSPISTGLTGSPLLSWRPLRPLAVEGLAEPRLRVATPLALATAVFG